MESVVNAENKWLDHEEVDPSESEFVMIDFVCLRKAAAGSSKNITERGTKCGVDITNKRIRIYDDEEFSEVKRKIKLK